MLTDTDIANVQQWKREILQTLANDPQLISADNYAAVWTRINYLLAHEQTNADLFALLGRPVITSKLYQAFVEGGGTPPAGAATAVIAPASNTNYLWLIGGGLALAWALGLFGGEKN